MTQPRALLADFIELEVVGYGIQKLLTVCGKNGIKLWEIRYEGEGCRMRAMGKDYNKILEIAGRGGWKIEEYKRHGPGKTLDRLRRRPGIIAGFALAVMLVKLLTIFIWKIDFSEVEVEQQPLLRKTLMENEIFEGAVLREDKLRTVEQALYLQTEKFGWISLNFTGGCLFVEQSPLLMQQVYEEPPSKALYANSNALIVSMKVKSGFAAAAVGQYVTKGQLLADNGKFSRSGNLVTQNAEGVIIGQIEKSYKADCALESKCKILSGKNFEQTKYFLFGKNVFTTGETEAGETTGDYLRAEELQPMAYGYFVLPGYSSKAVSRETVKVKIKRSDEMAQVIAIRNCKMQLLKEYPDAVIKTQSVAATTANGIVHCTCQYAFVANIAIQGEPPEHIFVAETAG